MNSGEGIKFAAKSKSGQLGILLFKDTKPNKNKKFGYKKKVQSFPIRKVTTTQDSEVNNKPAVQKKPAPDRSTSPKGRPSNPTDPKTGRKTTEQDTKKTGKDFVKRNAQRVSRKTKDEAKDTNTITLTQDQLNAILKSIGQVAGSDNVASVAIENGDVKVNTAEKEISPDKEEDSNKDSKDDETKGDDAKQEEGRATSAACSENIMALLAKGNKKEERTPSPTLSTKPLTPNKTPASIASKSPKKASKEKTSKKDENSKEERKEDAHQTESKETEHVVPVKFEHLSLAERKRRKWKQELDEQVALKRQQEEQEKLVRDVASRMGGLQLGSGARCQPERRAAPSRYTEQVEVRKSTENFSPDVSPRSIAPSSLGVIATQREVPAAMRASFLIGGQGSAGSRVNDFNAQVKKRQQQEWLQELEQQRIEAQQRKRQDKQSQRDFETNLTQQWAEPVNPPRTHQSIRGQPPQVRDDTAVMMRHADRESERREDVEQPRSAPSQGTEVMPESGSLTNRSEGRSHIRAHNLLLDPAEIERREAQKQKHLEHMLAVKAQVEEKQRLKREAEEKKRQEEAEEEMRLALQRNNLQRQFDLEKEKQRKKEETEAARHRALVESMQNAYQEAQQEKHIKRLDKLGKMGHDTSNLRHSWNNQHGSPENSPHQPINQAAYKSSPRAEQSTVPQPIRHSPVAPITHYVSDHVSDQVTHQVTHQVTEAPVMKDAFTSPVYDQAVQTEFHFPPSGDVSLQNLQTGRELSAGIEYKPSRQQANREPGKNRKSDQTQMDKAKERKTRTIQEEPQQAKVKSKRQTSRASSPGSEQEYARKKNVGVSERPVWGASTKNKKLQRNSDKDLTVSKKKRDKRRKQRAADLLAEQERNAPVRLTKAKRPKSPKEDTQGTNAILGSKPIRSRADSGLSKHANQEEHHHEVRQGRTASVKDGPESQPWTDGNRYLPDTPPLKNGDFVPFLRTDEPVMSEDSVPVTPESRQMQIQRQRKTVKTIVADNGTRQVKEETRRLPVQTEKDPLLNPDRLKDTEQRQERILQQLSHLRQGLMMKQREMEIGLNSPVMM